MLKDWISSCCVFCADCHNYFQSKLKGMGRSAVCAATQVQVCGETVELSQLHLLAAWLQYTVHWHGGRCPGCVEHEGQLINALMS